ncbi:phage portal protein [Streptomyces sp. NBC_01775]|uniref:phage portal protein n=1 Tax=Streptomyces sp. NBC_01775 TaxID=2975939 RepID=UPI002DD8F0BB|nr:phage portal protein [Streptomyces sp. NBC_01775]WSB74736.1 phage portal protein [Streptomyces sp. NBC_01775]
MQLTGAGSLMSYGAMTSLSTVSWEYAAIWRAQPQVRTVVNFLARNIAQLGLHVFRRVSDTDRERLTDHPLALLLGDPLPRVTTFRLVERLICDLAIYDEAYWIKWEAEGRRLLLPVPPTLICPAEGNWITPRYYVAAGGMRFTPDQVMHFHGYSPEDLVVGSSPLEALRALLLEESESTRQRAAMWRNGARATGVLVRPADAEPWSAEAKRRFGEMWRGFSQGGGAEGGTPILEDGMTYEQIAIDPQRAQYIESRKLTREEVAAAYHIPPPLVGILDHATYSNITEQHKILYQDTLGPWLTMVQQEIAANLLPDLADSKDVYVEFNIAEKMRGSFEEQAVAASTATGRPWMTVNEQRARFNLPQLPDGDELITPLNVSEGGRASPRDTAPEAEQLPKGRARPVKAKAGQPSTPQDDLRAQFAAALGALTEEEAARLVAAAPDGVDAVRGWWASGRAEKQARFLAVIREFMVRLGLLGARQVLEEFNPDEEGWSAEVMEPWLLAAALHHAELHDMAGETEAIAAAETPPPEGGVAAALLLAGAAWAAVALLRSETAATEALSFGGHDAARASGLRFKTWRTTSANPRAEHAALNGQKVPVDDVFSNGLRWPGDGSGDAAQTANCRCELTYSKTE